MTHTKKYTTQLAGLLLRFIIRIITIKYLFNIRPLDIYITLGIKKYLDIIST